VRLRVWRGGTVTGYWRARSLEVINRVIAEHPEADYSALRKALSAAYPFGEREHWPYKVWLACVREALTARDRQRAWRGVTT
jgi:hypothetical protein